MTCLNVKVPCNSNLTPGEINIGRHNAVVPTVLGSPLRFGRKTALTFIVEFAFFFFCVFLHAIFLRFAPAAGNVTRRVVNARTGGVQVGVR